MTPIRHIIDGLRDSIKRRKSESPAIDGSHGVMPVPVASMERILNTIDSPMLDDAWRARLLDGRAIERDSMGFGAHPALPVTSSEDIDYKSLLAIFGIELECVMAHKQLPEATVTAMHQCCDFSDWEPTPPEPGDKLIYIGEHHDAGVTAWFARERTA